MTLCWGKVVVLKDRPDQFIIKSQHFVQKLTIFDVITLLIPVELHVVGDQLFFSDVLEREEFWLVLVVMVAVWGIVVAVEESTTLGSRHAWAYSPIRYSRRAIDGWSLWHDTLALIFQVSQLVHDLTELFLTVFLLNWALTDGEHSFLVYEIACSRSAGKFTVDSFPVLLKVTLNMLQTIESRHLTWFLSCRLRGYFLGVLGRFQLITGGLQSSLSVCGWLTVVCCISLFHVIWWICEMCRILTIKLN